MAGAIRELQFEFTTAATADHLVTESGQTREKYIINTDIELGTQRVWFSPTSYVEQAWLAIKWRELDQRKLWKVTPEELDDLSRFQTSQQSFDGQLPRAGARPS